MVLMVPQYKTFVIANVGQHHNGDLSMAQQCAILAKEAGCDAVGFDMQFMPAEQERLIGFCRDARIECIPAPVDSDGLNLVMGLGVRRIRISNANVFNLKFLKDLNSWCLNEPRLHVMFSTFGMSRQEIDDTIKDVSATNFTLLHAQGYDGFDLLKIKELGFSGSTRISRIGFSDPGNNDRETCLAVLVGATVIDKCFTPNRARHMAEMVKTIREYEGLLGNIE